MDVTAVLGMNYIGTFILWVNFRKIHDGSTFQLYKKVPNVLNGGESVGVVYAVVLAKLRTFERVAVKEFEKEAQLVGALFLYKSDNGGIQGRPLACTVLLFLLHFETV
jgi:hypothetical protein